MKISYFLSIFALSLSLNAAEPKLRALPSNLWAMQAVLPPGTNGMVNTETVLPPGVPVPGGSPAAPQDSTGTPQGTPVVGGMAVGGVMVQSAPTSAGGGGPVGADGRMPGLPPGVPLPAPGGGSVGPGNVGGSGPQPSPSQPSPSVPDQPQAEPTPEVTEPECSVRLRLARIDISAEGGEFVAPANVQPLGCVPSISFVENWLSLTDTPAMRFAAEANAGTTVRDAMIVIGQTSFFVRQAPPVQPGLAAAPSHLVFGIDKKGKADKKLVTAWTEHGTGAFVARPGHPWLIVTSKSGKKNRPAFEVTVQPKAGLGPGRHDTFIDLVPAGTENVALRIPVVVEVTSRF